jgi:hypothetical protein
MAIFREKFVQAFKAEDGAHWLNEFQSYDSAPVLRSCLRARNY